MTVSEVIADFVVGTDYDEIPSQVIAKAKLCILDTLGCILLGGRSPWAPILREYLSEVGGEKQAHVIGLSTKTSAPHAAFATGVLAHVDDLDDIFWSIGHPSVAVLPATLALAETRQSSGRDLLTAFILGWEVACHLSEFLNPWHFRKGWHSTATIGILGAAIAASKVAGLDSERTCWALSMAACQSAGLRANFGTMTKAFHVGKVGLNGVMATMLAERGVNANTDVFEEFHGGFLKAYSDCDRDRTEAMKNNLGAPWKILNPGVLFKQYPCCSGTHPGIEAVLELREEHSFLPEHVDSINVLTDPGGTDMLTYDRPQDALQAKFSMHFCLALAITEGDVRPEHFTDAKVKEPILLSFMERIRMGINPELATKGYLSKSDTTIIIKLKDGRELSKRVRMARGNPERPFSEAELEDKFLRCAGEGISKNVALQCVQMIRTLEDIRFTADLAVLLSDNH